MSGLKSELLKYKRTFMGKLIIFIPVIFAVYVLVTQTSLMKDPMSESSSWKWESLLALIFNWWPFVFLPLGYALFAALAALASFASAAVPRSTQSPRSLRTTYPWVFRPSRSASWAAFSPAWSSSAVSSPSPACARSWCLYGGFLRAGVYHHSGDQLGLPGPRRVHHSPAGFHPRRGGGRTGRAGAHGSHALRRGTGAVLQ